MELTSGTIWLKPTTREHPIFVEAAERLFAVHDSLGPMEKIQREIAMVDATEEWNKDLAGFMRKVTQSHVWLSD